MLAKTAPIPHLDTKLNLQVIDFGPEVCGNLHDAERREWLVTNGIGGFASGTVAGLPTRRYHGLLFAALKPPLGRVLLLSKLDEVAEYEGILFSLSANRWGDGVIAPQGFHLIQRFHLEGTTPVWTYAFGDALLEKRIWMRKGENTTCVQYHGVCGHSPIHLTLNALVNYRDFHGVTHANGREFTIEPIEGGFRILAFEGAQPLYLICLNGKAEVHHTWHLNFFYREESDRGLEAQEDHLHAGTFVVILHAGETVTLVAGTNSGAIHSAANQSLSHRRRYEHSLLKPVDRMSQEQSKLTPLWIQQLLLAADQFIVSRPLPNRTDGHSVIAGYPWFGDWGRDTMISFPGLLLCTERIDIAKSLLQSFAQFVDQGMLPNRFPDAGERPEYNTVDATLWYFDAIRQYFEQTHDVDLLVELFPVMEDIFHWHVKGTRYHIQVDQHDGLLYAGEPGVQLTWMDAKVGDWVVTPRIGKAIEVNALWVNALTSYRQFAKILQKPTKEWDDLIRKARAGFLRFWNEESSYCFDVLDGPNGHDAALRPNQIIAVALPDCPLPHAQQRAVVDVCAHRLLTGMGLRSLSPDDPRYVGRYEGDVRQRDGAYHQGTVWGWLIGSFVVAYLRVYQDPEVALSFLQPFAHQLQDYGLGSIGEICDGDPPFQPRGCFAQAWTVAEVLRAWKAIQTFSPTANKAGVA